MVSAFVAAVVVTVSVEVCAVAPLRATLVGFNPQDGMSFTLDMDVVTLQVKFTVPVNPFVPTMLMAAVFPLVAPGARDKEVAPPVPPVKLGPAVILSEMLVVVDKVPEVPVMVTVIGEEVT